ncbi:C-X-C motif chemokine 10-like [Arapaima gigas]
MHLYMYIRTATRRPEQQQQPVTQRKLKSSPAARSTPVIMITKVLILLCLLAGVAFSQSIVGGSSKCLCKKTRDTLGIPTYKIQNMEVFPPSNFCDKMEIVINLKNGGQYCLNPNTQKIRDILKKMAKKQKKPSTVAA